MKLYSLVILLAVNTTVFAQENIKTMFYNLLEFPTASPGGRDVILGNILDNYEPDIFMVCELQSQDGADRILNTSLNDDGNQYVALPFVFNTSSGANLQQLLFYRRNMFTLQNTNIIQTDVRDINEYTLRLNTTDGTTNPVDIHIFVAHLKSSQGNDNEQKRLDMVTAVTDRFNDLDPNAFVLFAGDFNVYESDEPAYIEMLDPTNAITLADPIDTPGDWHNNESFRAVHTQSTRVSSGGFGAGAGGGMDDRFDFIMVSENMLTSPTLRYKVGTYKSFGNNGNCYNLDVRDQTCTGEFSQTLRNSIYSMSDHLPVIMELETDREIVLSSPEVSETTPQLFLERTIVSNILDIRVSSEISEDITIAIYNTLGQKLMHKTVSPSDTISLDVSQFANGIYYVTTDLQNSQTLKFLKAS